MREVGLKFLGGLCHGGWQVPWALLHSAENIDTKSGSNTTYSCVAFFVAFSLMLSAVVTGGELIFRNIILLTDVDLVLSFCTRGTSSLLTCLKHTCQVVVCVVTSWHQTGLECKFTLNLKKEDDLCLARQTQVRWVAVTQTSLVFSVPGRVAASSHEVLHQVVSHAVVWVTLVMCIVQSFMPAPFTPNWGTNLRSHWNGWTFQSVFWIHKENFLAWCSWDLRFLFCLSIVMNRVGWPLQALLAGHCGWCGSGFMTFMQVV